MTRSVGFVLVWTVLAAGPAWALKTESLYPALLDTVYVDTLPVPLNAQGEYVPETPYVLVHTLVGRDGRVKDTRILDAGISKVDSAAVATVRRSLFKPGVSEGKPTAVWVVMGVQFPPHLRTVVWMAGSVWGTRPSPPAPVRIAPRGSALAICDSLYSSFDAGLRHHWSWSEHPNDPSSDDLCVLYSEWQDREEAYGADLRKYLVARGWSEVLPPEKWAGGTRLKFRRGGLLLMAKGAWDDHQQDDVVQDSSFWKIVVGDRSHSEGQLLEILNRWED